MGESQNQRTFDRVRQRVPCVIRDNGTEHQGFVTDVSPSGLFLQTRAQVPSGTQLVVELDWNGESITVTGSVARIRRSNRSAAVVNTAGFGFQIQSAPESYFQLMVALQ